MTLDRSFVDLNRTSTERMRTLVGRLGEKDMQHPVGEHWTVAIALAHLAFWDRRILYILEMTDRDGKLFPVDLDALIVNELSLPLWAAIPAREAARLAVETAQKLDKRLEAFPPALLEEVQNHNKRWVMRALHRNEHLDEIDEAFKR